MGGLFWKLANKRVFMWRNHYKGSVSPTSPPLFAQKSSARRSFPTRQSIKKRSPCRWASISSRSIRISRWSESPRSILFLARLDESKRSDLLISALGILARQNIPFTATIAGGPSDARSQYPERLRAQVEKEGLAAQVRFVGAIPNTETFRQYRAHEIFVNCSRSGMLDKTMFKAVACGCLVATASRDFAAMVSDPRFIFPEGDAPALAERLNRLLALSPAEKASALAQLEKKVLNEQSLPVLMSRLVREMGVRAA